MPPFTRDRLARLPRRRLHGGRNVSKAIVDLVELEGRPVVLKDFASRPWPVRQVWGPWQLGREARAYAALAGLKGTPSFLGRVDRQAIVLEYVPGRTLASLRPGDLPGPFFDRLDRLLEEIHARGVAHGDLHRHDVLAGPDGEPCIVDFSTSIVGGRGAGAWSRFLFDQMRQADRRSAAKMRRRLLPGSGPEIPDRRGLYRLGGWGRRILDRLRGRHP